MGYTYSPLHTVNKESDIKEIFTSLLSHFSFEIQEEGPVQQITYVSDTERGYLRIVSEDEIDYPRWVQECCMAYN